jgi:hypothetical protein
MIGDVTIKPQATEPPIGEIEVDLLAHPPLRANAEAVADDQHAYHQLGIDRGPSHIAVIGPQMRPQIRQVDETVDLAKHVIVGDVPLEAEAVKQRLLHHPPLAHHRPNLLPLNRRESAPATPIKRSFSTKSTLTRHWGSRRWTWRLEGKPRPTARFAHA